MVRSSTCQRVVNWQIQKCNVWYNCGCNFQWDLNPAGFRTDGTELCLRWPWSQTSSLLTSESNGLQWRHLQTVKPCGRNRHAKRVSLSIYSWEIKHLEPQSGAVKREKKKNILEPFFLFFLSQSSQRTCSFKYSQTQDTGSERRCNGQEELDGRCFAWWVFPVC